MSQPVKVLIGPSSHYHQIKSGTIKYQQSKPSSPIWRILVLDEVLNKMHIRAYATQPSPTDIENVILGVLQGVAMSSVHIVIPATAEKFCPGLQTKLMDGGATVYLPGDGFASGARAGREWEKVLSSIESSLHFVGEAMASCEEIAATVPPLGIITTDLWHKGSDEAAMGPYHKASSIADQITRNRGRDPERGRKMWDKRLRGAPLNTATKEVPQVDTLNELLRNPNRYLDGYPDAELIWDIIQQLKGVRDAPPAEKTDLLANLGGTSIATHIMTYRGYYGGFFSYLRLVIRDPSLLYQISLGVKEACNRLIIVKDTLVQFAAGKVLVHYPEHCEVSLRRLPVHDHLEKMIQQICGGRVTISPDLTGCQPESVCHPVCPWLLEAHFNYAFGPFAAFHRRTPISPAQCFHKLGSGDKKNELMLHVVGILPRNADQFLPLGDADLADRMTKLVNERLARTCKGVTCTISPLQSFGDVMVIDKPQL